jgi:tRNA (guanine37-N1)-methyltransferase
VFVKAVKFTIVTLFPDFFDSPLSSGLLGQARENEIIETRIVNLRDYAKTKYKQCDDAPYGGGSGMVMMAEPLFRCLDDVKGSAYSVLTTPAGTPLTQPIVRDLHSKAEICVVCGRYEGIDERVSERYIDREISTGDYILSGGEYAALIMIDAVSRYVPGFMGNADSLEEESFEDNLLEYPHYTRPATIEGMNVPEVLLSGNHAAIKKWRHEQRIVKTKKVRPDLYKRYYDEIERSNV